MKEKFKSWVFWSSLAAQIVSILMLTGVIDIAQSEVINGVVASVLQCFVVFGVLNNPNERSSF